MPAIAARRLEQRRIRHDRNGIAHGLQQIEIVLRVAIGACFAQDGADLARELRRDLELRDAERMQVGRPGEIAAAAGELR